MKYNISNRKYNLTWLDFELHVCSGLGVGVSRGWVLLQGVGGRGTPSTHCGGGGDAEEGWSGKVNLPLEGAPDASVIIRHLRTRACDQGQWMQLELGQGSTGDPDSHTARLHLSAVLTGFEAAASNMKKQ